MLASLSPPPSPGGERKVRVGVPLSTQMLGSSAVGGGGLKVVQSRMKLKIIQEIVKVFKPRNEEEI